MASRYSNNGTDTPEAQPLLQPETPQPRQRSATDSPASHPTPIAADSPPPGPAQAASRTTAAVGTVARSRPGDPARSAATTSQTPLIPPRRPARTSTRSLRARVHQMVEGDIDSWFEYTLLGVIFINVLFLIVGTIPMHPKGDDNCPGPGCLRLGEKYSHVFEVVEWTSVYLFTVEYVLRIWSCIEDPQFALNGPVTGRLLYALTFYPLLDLLSILPNWVSVGSQVLDRFTPSDVYIETPDFTTAGRIFRLVRVFKTDKYLNAFGLLAGVLYQNRILLFATMFYSGMIWIIAASLLYYTEQSNDDYEMRMHFNSIPDALFPTVLMLTGEFPLVNFTPIGQVIAGFVAVVAVAIFAVPTSVLGSGFVAAIQQAQGSTFTMDME